MPQGKPPADACRAWIKALEASGAVVVIPAVVDYEVRRELLRAGFSAAVLRLDGLKTQFLYLPVSEAAWNRAAEFWALLRNMGLPTAGPQELDGDAILAGQALTVGRPGDIVTIATTNVGHMARFPGVDAQPWATIT